MKATRHRLPPSVALAVLLCCLLGASAQAQPTTIALRGATLIDGTGAPPRAAELDLPVFAHVELELMVQAGLIPMEAWIAATRRPAEMLGKADVFGTIEPGKRADLLVLDGNPLEDIRSTRTLELVIRGGEVIDRSSLLPDE